MTPKGRKGGSVFVNALEKSGIKSDEDKRDLAFFLLRSIDIDQGEEPIPPSRLKISIMKMFNSLTMEFGN